MFEAADDSAEIIDHSIKVAVALAELSSRLNISKSDCYLFGLLHNVGYIVLSRYDSSTYKTHYLKRDLCKNTLKFSQNSVWAFFNVILTF